MSEKYPECPLYNPLNCKEYHNPKLCALVRSDRRCLKKQKPRPPSGAEGPAAAAAPGREIPEAS